MIEIEAEWEIGGRNRATLRHLVERLQLSEVKLLCTDKWEAYAKELPIKKTHTE